MVNPGTDTGVMLSLTRTFAALREKVFEAWTHHEHLRNWWGMSAGHTAPIVEVDLRVGGRYRLGMQPPDDDELHVVGGVFREVSPPEKLVYTWAFEHEGMELQEQVETLVTVSFRDLGGSTELTITHEYFPSAEICEQHRRGWTMMLDNRFGQALES